MTHEQNTGRVAVVTGASSGIGAATARALAAGGYAVALLARRLDRIQTLAQKLGNGSIAVRADVTDRDSLLAAAARVQDELGGADVLVNNAGIMCWARSPPSSTTTTGPWSRRTSSVRSPPPRSSSTSSGTAELATWSTSPPSPAAPRAPGTASTPPPSGA